MTTQPSRPPSPSSARFPPWPHRRTLVPVTSAAAPGIATAVKRCVARSGMPEHDLDDLEQTTWVRLLERLPATSEITSIKGFASGIAKNVIREHKRTLSRLRHLDGNDLIDVEHITSDDHPLAAELFTETQELAAQVDRAKDHLSPSDRWLIDARFIDESSYAEMLPRFWRIFGRPIRTEQGLRSAVFNARSLLLLALEVEERESANPRRR